MEIRGAALVVGVDGGLGRAVARRLRGEGCSLLVAGCGSGVEAFAQEVDGVGVVADLGSSGEVRRVVGLASDVDVLVVLVGGGEPGGPGVLGLGVDELDRAVDLNLRAPLLLARLAGERMVGKGRGHVVFVTSLVAKRPGGALDSATAFGVRGFALALRQEWEPLGVGVSCVNVGPVEEGETADGVALPAGFRPKSFEDVAQAVVRAIRHDRAEVDVADPVMRAGVVFGQLAPQAAARFNRIAGDDAAGER
ncbi:SDR family NAD(P)-dependent oxidoreductase [Actinophytocola glycyrrhizae]|uniref:SDR family NAD(P)-dependent oxidoreductase n=1 Tax=Actinophytocola glycyrrhizae TaxID=2044873 RepID=A0ABV9S930_9PSEU